MVEPGSYRTEIFSTNAVVAEGSDMGDSIYKDFSSKMRRRIEKMVKDPKAMGDPEDVAMLIERIMKMPRPKKEPARKRETRAPTPPPPAWRWPISTRRWTKKNDK